MDRNLSPAGKGVLKKPSSVQGATDRQVLQLFAESACPCPFLTI
jgi:hypothetical protein